ncbi:sensor histidine kinase [Psychrobacillus sp.]|uniref:sensor histidine kinase n=1 Tax=Psychrobacillus sp. TaxID=1871623 RepID=UPI0028BF089E|nr:sensor histidine kinase [Psychrobacillus sp.]
MVKIKIYPREQAKQYLIIDVITIIFFITMVLSSNSDLSLLSKIVLIVLILISFYIALWYRDWRLLIASLLGFSLLTIVSIFEGAIMLTFGFLFADLVGRARVKWHIGLAMIVIALMFVVVLWFETGQFLKIDPPILIPIMMIQIVLPGLIYFLEKTKKLQGELAEVNKQFVLQEERHRIARDLHDTIGHTLTMIKLKTELTTKLVDKDLLRVKNELDDILTTTRTALKQVRELVSDMRFISLESELINSSKLMKTAGISFTLHKKDSSVLLSSVEETMVSLCVREAMTNIIKHSQAKHCAVHIEISNQVYTLQIIDDGIGSASEGRGNGITSMKERMHALQGTAFIEDTSIGGTVVTIKFPIPH